MQPEATDSRRGRELLIKTYSRACYEDGVLDVAKSIAMMGGKESR